MNLWGSGAVVTPGLVELDAPIKRSLDRLRAVAALAAARVPLRAHEPAAAKQVVDPRWIVAAPEREVAGQREVGLRGRRICARVAPPETLKVVPVARPLRALEQLSV